MEDEIKDSPDIQTIDFHKKEMKRLTKEKAELVAKIKLIDDEYADRFNAVMLLIDDIAEKQRNKEKKRLGHGCV